MPGQEGKMGRLRLLRIVCLHPGYDHSRTVIGQIKPVPTRPIPVFGSSGTALMPV